MQERVAAIVNYLIRQSLDPQKKLNKVEEMIQNLIDLGFETAEIDAAFEILLAEPEKGKDPAPKEELFRPVWIFGQPEEAKLSSRLRGRLLSLYSKSYLSCEEMNEILLCAMKMEKDEVDLIDLGYLLASVIKEEARLEILLPRREERRLIS